MERLTRRGGKNMEGMIWFVDHENNNMSLEPCEIQTGHARKMLEKLAEYEDEKEKAEEKSMLVSIPCKPGDTVYAFMPNHIEEGYYEGEVQSIVIDKNGSYATVKCDEFTRAAGIGIIGNWVIPFYRFEETAFLSREKAEALFQENFRQEER